MPMTKRESRRRILLDTALLIIRSVLGGLMIGHGAQKLFGLFGGYGVQGTAGWLESLGLKPGKPWAVAAGLSEFGGGMLTLLGFLNPIGPVGVFGSMGMAIAKVHPLTKPIWVTSGGAELPLTNIALATALMLAGPGRYSLDHTLGTRLPRWMAVPGVAAAMLVVGVALTQQPQQQEQPQQEQEQPQQQAAGESETGSELERGA